MTLTSEVRSTKYGLMIPSPFRQRAQNYRIYGNRTTAKLGPVVDWITAIASVLWLGSLFLHHSVASLVLLGLWVTALLIRSLFILSGEPAASDEGIAVVASGDSRAIAIIGVCGIAGLGLLTYSALLAA